MSTTATPPADSSADLILPRTYESALHLLSLLPTNKDTTSLFDAASSPESTSESTNVSALTASFPTATSPLNAQAIPEMREWLSRAGLPDVFLGPPDMRVIHVAGTKGKGSTCAFITALLVNHPDHHRDKDPYGWDGGPGRVGTYMSPHVASVRERILLDGDMVDKKLFMDAVFEIWQRLAERSELSAGDNSFSGSCWGTSGQFNITTESGDERVRLAAPGFPVPFYFRFLTLVALYIFLRESVKTAVIECGIGGEFDSTNALPDSSTSVSVITPLGLDHVMMLGKTVGEIAWHKAGILKEGRVGVTGLQSEEAMAMLRARAEEKGARLVEVGGQGVVKFDGPEWALAGAFQRANMVLAFWAVKEHLKKMGAKDGGLTGEGPLPDWAVKALKGARLKGRCERLTTKIHTDSGSELDLEWFLDGAHTVESLSAAASVFLAHKSEPGVRDVRILIFNQQDRDPAPLVKALISQNKSPGQGTTSGFDYAIFTRNEVEPPPKIDPSYMAAQEAAARTMEGACGQTPCATMADVTAAVSYAKNLAVEEQANGEARVRVFVTGSFHLVRGVLKVLQPDETE